MGKFKRVTKFGFIVGMLVMMTSVFALQANAAKIEFMVKDITEPNLTVTVDDGTVYTKKIEPSVGYKLPATLLMRCSSAIAV